MSLIDRFGRSRVASVAVILIVASLAVGAIATLLNGRLHYKNYWGGAVFAPFVLVVVAIVLLGAVRHYLVPRDVPRRLRGRAARKATQAERTTFPIDEFRKW